MKLLLLRLSLIENESPEYRLSRAHVTRATIGESPLCRRDADVDTIPNKGEQRLAVDLADRGEIFAKFLQAPTVLDNEVECIGYIAAQICVYINSMYVNTKHRSYITSSMAALESFSQYSQMKGEICSNRNSA